MMYFAVATYWVFRAIALFAVGVILNKVSPLLTSVVIIGFLGQALAKFTYKNWLLGQVEEEIQKSKVSNE